LVVWKAEAVSKADWVLRSAALFLQLVLKDDAQKVFLCGSEYGSVPGAETLPDQVLERAVLHLSQKYQQA
jgi:hypothetical protein